MAIGSLAEAALLLWGPRVPSREKVGSDGVPGPLAGPLVDTAGVPRLTSTSVVTGSMHGYVVLLSNEFDLLTNAAARCISMRSLPSWSLAFK